MAHHSNPAQRLRCHHRPSPIGHCPSINQFCMRSLLEPWPLIQSSLSRFGFQFQFQTGQRAPYGALLCSAVLCRAVRSGPKCKVGRIQIQYSSNLPSRFKPFYLRSTDVTCTFSRIITHPYLHLHLLAPAPPPAVAERDQTTLFPAYHILQSYSGPEWRHSSQASCSLKPSPVLFCFVLFCLVSLCPAHQFEDRSRSALQYSTLQLSQPVQSSPSQPQAF
ncbi:hypothetical protein BKA65DRAFT_72901 [Rhexocercosporidium sp. MPI-PUGE-AT-0058]|nr:hypothetical protein BKA65DRAFT_72901 [Rhexocercosporidium sp. MPI-PUGE-AT-0058]